MAETKFTPGPWEWHGSSRGIYLATVDRGKTYVMGFRRMGMNGAQPTFQYSRVDPGKYGMLQAMEYAKFEVGNRAVTGLSAAKKDESVYRYDIAGIAHPDAHLIAAAPTGYGLIARAVDEGISEKWREEALAYMEAVNGKQ